MQKLSGKYQVTNDFPADKMCQMVFLDGFIERIKWGLVFLEQINGFQTCIHATAKRLHAKPIPYTEKGNVLHIVYNSIKLRFNLPFIHIIS